MAILPLALYLKHAHLSGMNKTGNTKSNKEDLVGKLLIAMPSMGDPRFGKSVVYICAHTTDGAMGLIINKPTPDLKFKDLLEQLSIPSQAGGGIDDGRPIFFGGPVETARGFVLHTSDYKIEEMTLAVTRGFCMTATRDILADMAKGQGPDQAILALGYAGWGPGQLEAELQQNGWLVAEGARDLVFSEDNSGKWTAALQTLGIDPSLLSLEGGRA